MPVARSSLLVACIAYCVRSSDESAENARGQRIRAQPIRAVILILALACGENSRNVGRLVEVHPQAAHGVMHARENLHWRGARIVAHKLLINFQNTFKLSVERGAVNVGQVKINHRLAIDAEVLLVNNFKNGAGRDISRYQVAILRIPLFEEIPALVLRNTLGIALVARILRDPYPSPFAAGRLRHQPQFVFSRDRSRVNLDELAVGVITALLIECRLCRPSADNGIC